MRLLVPLLQRVGREDGVCGRRADGRRAHQRRCGGGYGDRLAQPDSRPDYWTSEVSGGLVLALGCCCFLIVVDFLFL